ncbi:hypothetical protein [Peribacillus glennii]|nr:hypothetical protein [Peribacillus glennii]
MLKGQFTLFVGEDIMEAKPRDYVLLLAGFL